MDNVENKGANKKLKGCIIGAAAAAVLVIAGIVFLAYSFGKAWKTEYTSFDADKLAYAESTLGCDIPDSVTPVRYLRDVGAGDAQMEFWVEDISDPSEYMKAAYADTEYTEHSGLDEISGTVNTELLKYGRENAGPAAVYTCKFDPPEDSSRYIRSCALAFYKDGSCYKMKQVAVYA